MHWKVPVPAVERTPWLYWCASRKRRKLCHCGQLHEGEALCGKRQANNSNDKKIYIRKKDHTKYISWVYMYFTTLENL
jgi:hypothetical protein